VTDERETPAELAKAYQHQQVEARWYRFWMERGYFRADAGDRSRQPFCIVLPPPNVTGSLHLGHALTATLQDVLCRWKRMSGFNVLWLPGTDHAGIATQMVVEKEIQRSEGKSRHDLGRAAFLARVWAWKEKYGSRIGEQHQALGASLDWSRERFTMDEGLSRAVREVFVRLYEENLVYREKKLINWCPRCQTALSDLEVHYEENHPGELWSFAYPLVEPVRAQGQPDEAAPERAGGLGGLHPPSMIDTQGQPAEAAPERAGEEGSARRRAEAEPEQPIAPGGQHPPGMITEIVVATTRPETMLGDTAVAVHPDDERWRAAVGRKVRHPLLDRELPVIADAVLVDPKFGTGAVKVTPAHDFNDFETGRRHGLPMISVIGPDGRMTAEAGPFADQDRFEARRRVKEALAQKGLDRGSKPHLLPLGRCQRCETILEPLLSDQWFVRIEPLARAAIQAVEQGRTRFIPEGWTNTYMAWMRNIHDWCISRQLWWGHQIPAWYCPDGHWTVARERPRACAACGLGELRQDEDVLDTWFSSALWPFSTLGWPDRTGDLATFYPTSVMETGHDIIFFWVARMMMMGLHFMEDVPFRVVFLHPMVRDEKGQKMSKTKGNVIDPLDITGEHGADALRFTLAALTTAQGRDIKLSSERIEGYRAFANKLWNATRFALMNLQGFTAGGEDPALLARTPADHWLLSRLARAVNETVGALEAFRFDDTAGTIYQFVWHDLCDWYIELSKEALRGEDAGKKRAAQAVLAHALDTALRLLHPIMPFVTEELWQTLKKAVGASGWAESIMVAPYPEKRAVDEAAERSFGPVIGVIDAIRNIRGEMNVPWKTPLRDVEVGSLSPEALATVRQEQGRILRLANVEGFTLREDGRPTERRPGSAVSVGEGFEVRVPLAGVVDMAAERARVDKELARVAADLAGVRKRLANPSFVQKAPPEVVDEARDRAEELEARKAKLEVHRRLVGEGETRSGPAAPAAERTAARGEAAAASGPSADLGARLRAEAERTARAGAADTREAEAAAERIKEGLARQAEPLGPAYMEMGVVEATPAPPRPGGTEEGGSPKPKPARRAGTGAKKEAKPGKAGGAKRSASARKSAKGKKRAGPRKPAGKKRPPRRDAWAARRR
jgi:valyl-tRNA synthetase